MLLVDIDTTLLETDRSKPPVPRAATKGGRPQRARMELAMQPGITAEALTCVRSVENQGTIGGAVYGERECSLTECD